MMGTGEASGESRATQAAEAAINNPLLDDTTMKGAHAVLINITGGMDMTLFEVDEAANRIRKEVDDDATIIFGSAFDDKLEGVMRVSVVATGIDASTQALGKPSTASTPAVVANLRPSTTVPNPPAGFVPTQPAIAETNMAHNNAPAEAALSLDIATRADADVINADSGPDNTAEHRDLSDNADQLDIDDAIAKSAGADAPDETSSQQDDNSVTTDTDPAAPLVAQIDNETTSDMATPEAAEVADTAAAPRVGFIPAQTTALPDAETVPVAMETPAKRPASLINKISGLWSTKPNTAEPASRKEPAIGEAQASASILDLSRSDVVHRDVNDTDKAKFEVSDDELDIPAFLRRQAN
jgi:cell division protein FtsZ